MSAQQESTFSERSLYAQKLDWIRLNLIRGLGPRLRQALLERFSTPESILQAQTSELLSVPGIGRRLAQSISQAANRMEAIAEYSACHAKGFTLVTPYDAIYPASLKEIPDPPGTLYVHGRILESDALAFAIVGSRHATRYGLNQTSLLAAGLAKAGYTIVSGLARGIDTAAHRAAISAGGRTLAVLGSGLQQVYPPENQDLANEVAEQGAVLTEHALDHQPKSTSFPQRNRIISGLSLGVIVIEAAKRSGALITVRHALEQNRDVFALPGRADSRMSAGCHQLIRDGAKLVENVDHILEELGPLSSPTVDSNGHTVSHPLELKLNEQERILMDLIDVENVSIEYLVEQTGISVSRVLATLSVLESKKMIERVSGTQVCRRSCFA